MAATALYIAASVNRSAHAITVSRTSSHVLFGSNKFICCWDTTDDTHRGISCTIPGHEAEVTAVRWIKEDNVFCSADQNGSLLVWTLNETGHWRVIHRIQAHSRGISVLACYDHIIVTGSSEGVLNVFIHDLNVENNASPPRLTQTIDMKGRFPLAAEISRLPGSSALVMAIASTDCNIRIFTRSGGQFVFSLSLEGHEDWVKCLAFSPFVENGDISACRFSLASGSQDGFIRLWTITPVIASPRHEREGPIDELMDQFEKNLEIGDDAEEGGKKISNRAHIFSVSDGTSSSQFSLTFDALLVGHEAGVTSVSWQPRKSSETLLSTSTDSSLILWSPSDVPVAPPHDSASSPTMIKASLWMIRQRFGDVGGVKPGGFVGGLWARGGKEVLGFGWNGSWRRWRDTSQLLDGDDDVVEAGSWVETPAVLGHCAPVRGLGWDPEGKYLISTSLDQTTRIHGPWKRDASSLGVVQTWHEISRPQIHGYDLISATFLGPMRFVSVADEKVARVFEAPKGFIKTLNGLGITESDAREIGTRPAAAVVPPLGLSNKATGEHSRDTPAIVAEEDAEMYRRAPLEPELGALTLWPESEKVFGHGYELLTVASSHDGKLLATACKSSSPDHAVVRLYDTTTWRAIGRPLGGHSLTVTRISFSPDDRMVLTVSRDRSWRLFTRDEDGGYIPLSSDKSHSRVIWDCAWALEGDIFATAARDKMVKIWKPANEDGSEWNNFQTIKLSEPATSIDFARADQLGRRRMAVGTESGNIVIYEATVAGPGVFGERLSLDHSIAHVDQIHRLAWRPSQARHSPDSVCDLAMCAEDRSLRILRITFS